MDLDDLEANLQSMLKDRFNTQRPETLETIQVPASAVLELYTRLDAFIAIQGKPGTARARYEAMSFLENTIPYLKGHDYTIDTCHALHPVIRINGKDKKPQGGVDGVLITHEIPPDRLFEFFELYDEHERGSRVGRYEFWKFVSGLFPIDTTRPWKILANTTFYGIVLYAKDEILLKAQQEAAAAG